jgi:hypothetical protein
MAALLAALGGGAVRAVASTMVTELSGLLRIGSEDARLSVVLFPGARVESDKYVEMAKAIVEQADGDVSVFIADRFANVTNPIEARGRVQTVINLMTRRGEDDVRSRIFLAGHSQGGIGVYGLPVSMDLGGLILLGSYIPRTVLIGQTLADYKKPVLTLGGELDGLTGVNYLAREAQSAQALAAEDDGIPLLKPVILLPGVNHMQFADGSTIDGDLPAEVDTEAAHQAIAQRVVNFLDIHAPASTRGPEAAAAAQRIDVQTTLGAIGPYVATAGVEAGWCERAQVRASALEAGSFERVDFDTRIYKGVVGKAQFVLDKAKVQKDGDRYQLHLPVFVQESPGPLDISKDHALSPESMWCKMRTQEALISETAAAASAEAAPGCAELNQWVIEETLGMLDASSQARLAARYGAVADWQTSVGTDRVEYGPFVISSSQKGTGQAWVAGEFSMQPTEGGWKIDTVELKTGLDTWVPAFAGAHYCKLVTPGRIVEWATLFGLKQ